MQVAIRNLHHSTLANPLPFYNYVLGLLQSGVVTHLFFEDVSLTDPTIRAALSKYSWDDLNLSNVRFIFSAEELNRECDVLISLDSQPRDFSPAVKNFKGLKIYHLMDYFWGEPLSQKVARLKEHGVEYVMSYGSPDIYDAYFKHYAPSYIGRVIPVPFGYSPRFSAHIQFKQRLHRCVALGSVRPLRFSTEPEYKYKEQSDFLSPEEWFHKFRRMIVERKDTLSDIIDSLLPEFPRYRDYTYDQAETLNQYQTFVSDESLFFFPSAKAFEGPACGTVMVCSKHPSFADLGFEDGVNCIMHKEFDIDDMHRVVKEALANQEKLTEIAKRGEEFVRQRYTEVAVGRKLAAIVAHVYENPGKVGDLAAYAYELYRSTGTAHVAKRLLTPSSFAAKATRSAFILGSRLYRLCFALLELPGRIIRKVLRMLRAAKLYLWRMLRIYRNSDTYTERRLRRIFEKNWTPKPLSAPSQKEEGLISALRSEINALPAPKVFDLAGPARKWSSFVLELRHKIQAEDPRKFLSWPVIANNMVYRAGVREFAAIVAQKDHERWETALKEPEATLHQPFYLYPEANENTVRQAYHLATLRSLTTFDVTDFDTIVDFGGGFGGMCRLTRKLGFKGKYVIFDWKEFSALQRFYLGLSEVEPALHANTIDELNGIIGSSSSKTLLIATWSLSEAPTELREAIWGTVKPSAALITYQKEFGGVDNEAYFSDFIQKHNELIWIKSPMRYLPTEHNIYLIGSREL